MGVMWLVIIAIGVCVYFDAKSLGMGRLQPGENRGFLDMSPIGWGLACVLLGIFALPLYLIHRSQFVSKKSTPLDRVSDVDALERLAQLKERGILTEGKFQKKKKEILGL